ncbi:hypothetical protein GCM10028824_09930 [Hymenobacter segetis]|uniref:Uncharacterized protein n=1 Tax=Hymenobacter segetis TaxID=2025509 RepID=A0ABU9LSH6_9BACT
MEFLLDSSDADFNSDLLATIQDINPKIDGVIDLWMNDEVIFQISSSKGWFSLSKDIWDFAFIMADNNQPIIKLIAEFLGRSNLFEKEEVDFDDYKEIKR